MHLLGIVLGGEKLGLRTTLASDEAGVTAEAELEVWVGAAAQLERGKDQLWLLTSRVLVYTPVYNGTEI